MSALRAGDSHGREHAFEQRGLGGGLRDPALLESEDRWPANVNDERWDSLRSASPHTPDHIQYLTRDSVSSHYAPPKQIQIPAEHSAPNDALANTDRRSVLEPCHAGKDRRDAIVTTRRSQPPPARRAEIHQPRATPWEKAASSCRRPVRAKPIRGWPRSWSTRSFRTAHRPSLIPTDVGEALVLPCQGDEVWGNHDPRGVAPG
jgi:hypothetical protein